MKKIKFMSFGIFLISIVGISIYFLFFHINITQYKFYKTLRYETSPNGQYEIDLILLGKNEETLDKLGNLVSSNNKIYYEYARLWYNPEIRSDGTTMWHDKNTKIIYYQKDCTKEELEWLDDSTVRINGVTLNIHTDVYDYRRD